MKLYLNNKMECCDYNIKPNIYTTDIKLHFGHQCIKCMYCTSLYPTWQHNDSRVPCVICKKRFGFFRWFHHCRSCGNLVCNSCSKARKRLDGVNKVRVCDNCKYKDEETLTANRIKMIPIAKQRALDNLARKQKEQKEGELRDIKIIEAERTRILIEQLANSKEPIIKPSSEQLNEYQLIMRQQRQRDLDYDRYRSRQQSDYASYQFTQTYNNQQFHRQMNHLSYNYK